MPIDKFGKEGKTTKKQKEKVQQLIEMVEATHGQMLCNHCPAEKHCYRDYNCKEGLQTWLKDDNI